MLYKEAMPLFRVEKPASTLLSSPSLPNISSGYPQKIKQNGTKETDKIRKFEFCNSPA